MLVAFSGVEDGKRLGRDLQQLLEWKKEQFTYFKESLSKSMNKEGIN